MLYPKKFAIVCIAIFISSSYLYYAFSTKRLGNHRLSKTVAGPRDSPWATLPQRYPVTSFIQLPTASPLTLPRVQHRFGSEKPEDRVTRLERQSIVQQNLVHAWTGYKRFAWGRDELAPISKGYRDTFGGWAATLVDTLDTLWIMGLRQEFDAAVIEATRLNFSSSVSEELNVFETTIRYLGGLLSAYDFSGNELLLAKALELGDMLYAAFDTPNRLPVTRWKWKDALDGKPQEAQEWAVSAEVGSLSLEFTRLSQLSGDPKFFDAVQRITNVFREQQGQSKLRGMWPVFINPRESRFADGNEFSLGAMADSLYEYLPKQYMLTGGLLPEYAEMYREAIQTARQNLFFRPLNQDNADLLISGIAKINEEGNIHLDPQGQHLVCFAGGMVAIAARLLGQDEDMETAIRLVNACIWAYESTASGLMPETFHAIPCVENCTWDVDSWHAAARSLAPSEFQGTAEELISQQRLPPGFANIPDRRYILRPEAIESIFILYRITGDRSWQDRAWKMFEAVEKHARTEIAHACIDDVTSQVPPKSDRMESFWTAETLKYYYLLYSEPGLVSLDDYVFNTEAHPFKRPK